MISVVIPLYNKEKQIRKTLESVFAQTYTDYEVVIVNDGSTDDSVKVVEEIIKEAEGSRQRAVGNRQEAAGSHPSGKIRLIHQENAGVSAARNKGIAEARGEYIALLDGDDEWKPEYLATQADMIKRYPECQVFATNYELKDQNNNITYPIIKKIFLSETDGIFENYFESACISAPPIWTSAVVFTKKAFDSVGGFPVGIPLGEDLITWTKLACRYKIAYSKTPLAIYHNCSQEQRLIPFKKPKKDDAVGVEFDKLVEKYDIPFLKEYAARWHKIMMVTLVQLQRRKEARKKYAQIKRLIKPGKKEKLWYVLSFLPIQFTHLFLKYKNRLK